MQGEFKTLTNENIGPVPALDTLRIDVPNATSAAFFITETKGSDEMVLAAASP